MDVSEMRLTLYPCSKEPCVIVRGKTVPVEIAFAEGMLYLRVALTCGLLLGLSMLTESLNFRDCGSMDVSVMRVTLPSCSKEPCVTVRGKTTRLKLSSR
ncbi:hypothetical protein X801_07909, partial [Opisthorchis viverrini]